MKQRIKVAKRMVDWLWVSVGKSDWGMILRVCFRKR